jgi:hypothetical protein
MINLIKINPINFQLIRFEKNVKKDIIKFIFYADKI